MRRGSTSAKQVGENADRLLARGQLSTATCHAHSARRADLLILGVALADAGDKEREGRATGAQLLVPITGKGQSHQITGKGAYTCLLAPQDGLLAPQDCRPPLADQKITGKAAAAARAQALASCGGNGSGGDSGGGSGGGSGDNNKPSGFGKMLGPRGEENSEIRWNEKKERCEFECSFLPA